MWPAGTPSPLLGFQSTQWVVTDVGAHELMRGIGNLCAGAESDPRYNAARMVELLIAGLRTTPTD